jgi:hypothetical protein
VHQNVKQPVAKWPSEMDIKMSLFYGTTIKQENGLCPASSCFLLHTKG